MELEILILEICKKKIQISFCKIKVFNCLYTSSNEFLVKFPSLSRELMGWCKMEHVQNGYQDSEMNEKKISNQLESHTILVLQLKLNVNNISRVPCLTLISYNFFYLCYKGSLNFTRILNQFLDTIIA